MGMTRTTKSRTESTLRMVDDLEALRESIDRDPLRVEPGAEGFAATDEEDGGLESMPVPRTSRRDSESEELRAERERLFEAGRRAVDKLSESRSSELSEDEQSGLEAIVLLRFRPALLIQGGTFADPPDEWSVLARPDVRPRIETTIRSVGRIEAINHPAGLDWIGTGFLVADDVVMTNRHVAMEFARTTDGATWGFPPRMKVRIDYVEEYGSTAKAEFNITGIIGVHDGDVDMALLRVSSRGSTGAKRPKPLPLAANPKLDKNQKLYVVGYPASDSRRNDPVEMRRIFENIFDVKRLQPGVIMKLTAAGKLLTHDCSTLGGNSGSAVVDLDTHQVVGLHFGGKYLMGNSAHVLSTLQNDPLVRKADLQFV
jgi:V8-like Glu-specific endopeptidase